VFSSVGENKLKKIETLDLQDSMIKFCQSMSRREGECQDADF